MSSSSTSSQETNAAATQTNLEGLLDAMTLQKDTPESQLEDQQPSHSSVPRLPLEIIELFVSAFIDTVTDSENPTLVAALSKTRSLSGPWNRQMTQAQSTVLALLHTSRYVRTLITTHLMAHIHQSEVLEEIEYPIMPFVVDTHAKVEAGVTAALRWYMRNATQTHVQPLVMPKSNEDILVLGKEEIYGFRIDLLTDGSTFSSYNGRQFSWTSLAEAWRQEKPQARMTTSQAYEVIREAFTKAEPHARCVNPYQRVLNWSENKPLIDVAVMVRLYGRSLMPDPIIWTVRQGHYQLRHYQEPDDYDEDELEEDEDDSFEWGSEEEFDEYRAYY